VDGGSDPSFVGREKKAPYLMRCKVHRCEKAAGDGAPFRLGHEVLRGESQEEIRGDMCRAFRRIASCCADSRIASMRWLARRPFAPRLSPLTEGRL
jgi:hypothetical protein